MVKSKVPKKTIGIVTGLGIGVVLFFLFALPIILVVPDVAPQVNEDDLLTIPFPMPEPDQVVIKDPNDIVYEEIFDDDGNQIELIPTDPIAIVPPEEEEMVNEAINMTQGSEDPPIEQIIDLIFEPQTIRLEANIVKIDSTLQRFNETFTFDIPLASLFVEDTTNIDFRNGFIEIRLNMITDADTQINADGTFNVEIDGTELFIEDIGLISSGLTDQNGSIELSFKPLSSISTSKLYMFDFDSNFDKFLAEDGVSKVSFIIKTLDVTVRENIVCITTPCEGQILQMNGLIDQEILTMEIFKSTNQILILDIDGNQIRSFPMDDKFTITSQTASFTCKWSGSRQTHCSPPAPYVCATYIAPNISLVTLKDQLGTVIDSGSGTGLLIDSLLFRNANYSITSSNGNFDISTPKSQLNYGYACYETPDSVSRITYNLFSRGITCGTGTMSQPSTSTHVVCNFP